MLSSAEVTVAFQAILRRAPENSDVIEHHRGFATMADLCRALIDSEEFRTSLQNAYGHGLTLTLGDLDQAATDFNAERKDRWRGRVLELPDWFDQTIPAGVAAYRQQMLQLWSAITGRPEYVPDEHEDTPEIANADAIFRPAFYATGDSAFAGGQLMAMGHVILRSRLHPGDRMLEYGAGFGQTALALARLGVQVDTVDINPAFCRLVEASARHYDVKLLPHIGQFGHNPAGEDNAYDVVLFYESFHHCVDFAALIERLPTLLKSGGRVLLAGEPIFDGPCAEMPYQWGFRLDWENAAIMRHRGWMELGFQKDFLLEAFDASGFECRIHTDPNSHWAQIYEFVLRS